jgi:hypothetical protein
MAETSLDRRFGQVHQRMDAHEGRLAAHDGRITKIEIDASASAVRWTNIDERLTAVQSGITWITRLVIAGIVGGVLAFILQGGLNVGP